MNYVIISLKISCLNLTQRFNVKGLLNVVLKVLKIISKFSFLKTLNSWMNKFRNK